MISARAAAEKTLQLVYLMPAEWRGDDVKAGDLAQLRERKDCRALLKEITRARGPRGRDQGAAHGPVLDFFLSTPVETLGTLVCRIGGKAPPFLGNLAKKSERNGRNGSPRKSD